MSKYPPNPNWILVIGLVLLLTVTGGCKKKAAQTAPETPDATETAQPAEPSTPPAETEPVELEPDFPAERGFDEGQAEVAEIDDPRGVLERIYFDFDKSDLSDTARMTLRRNADWLKNNPSFRVIVEGHCDERGTIEYNLALGQRRANAVREYLVSLDVPANRLRIVSFGEERPAQLGHDDSAWSMNRRAEFVVE